MSGLRCPNGHELIDQPRIRTAPRRETDPDTGRSRLVTRAVALIATCNRCKLSQTVKVRGAEVLA